MDGVLLIHYSEIGTKGKNRSFFEKRLRKDVRTRLFPAQVSDVQVENARLIAPLVPGFQEETIHAALAQVFGIAWYAFARSLPRELEPIQETCLALARGYPDAKTFKIFCRRVDKTFPFSSQETCNRLGRAVGETLDLKVDLDDHDLPIHVDILPDRALVYAGKKAGLRGMPGGSSGKMLCLFSGGIDSPVAAWQLMRRGAVVHLLHFHPFRRAEEMLDSKIIALHKQLLTYNPECRLYLLPHYHYQVEAALKVPPAFETVVFRRFMFKTAEALARERRMKALITGDCLGQVASQTLDNLAAAQTDLKVPIFMPLIAHDKDDIVRLAQKIGTFDLSNLPYKDCCSLMSKKPKTNVSVAEAQKIEAGLDMPGLVSRSLASLEMWDGGTLRAAAPAAPRTAVP